MKLKERVTTMLSVMADGNDRLSMAYKEQGQTGRSEMAYSVAQEVRSVVKELEGKVIVDPEELRRLTYSMDGRKRLEELLDRLR